MDGMRILRGCRRAALALVVVLARFAWGSTYSYDRIGHRGEARSYGAWTYQNPPSSYNPAASSLSEQDEAHENWMKDIELAREKGSVAEFAMHKIPAYRSKILTAMGNGDYGRVQALDQEISDFVKKNREGLQPWANLQRSGPQGVALSERVRQILDGSYKDAWALASTSQGGQAQTLRQFLIEWSAEAQASRLKSFARRHGLNMGLARAIADEGDALHPLFANDKRIYVEIDTMPGIALADDERVRMASDWIRTKWSLAHDKEVVSAFTGEDGNLDVQELTAFLSAWENNLSRAKNGGISIIKDAIASYKELKDSGRPMRPATFVQDFVRFQGGLTRTMTTVNDKGVVTSQQPSPVSMEQAMGLVNAALRVGRKLGLSSRQILGNVNLLRLLADQNAATQNLRDFGFKIYSPSESPNENVVESVFAQLKVPGAKDWMTFYYDGMAALNKAIMTPPEVVVLATTLEGVPQLGQDRDMNLKPLELSIRKALANSILSQRQGNESWATTEHRIRSAEGGMALVKEAVRKAIPRGVDPVIANAIVEAYVWDLFGRGSNATRVNALDVLRKIACPTNEETAQHIPTERMKFRRAGRLLGSPIRVQVPVLDEEGVPMIGLDGVQLTATEFHPLRAGGSETFALQLWRHPDEVMPVIDGDTKELGVLFSEIGRCLCLSDGDEKTRQLERAVAKAIASGGEAPNVPDVETFLLFEWGPESGGIPVTSKNRQKTAEFSRAVRSMVEAAGNVGKLQDILWLAYTVKKAAERKWRVMPEGGHRLLQSVALSPADRESRRVLEAHGFLDNGKLNMESGLRHLEKEFSEEAAKSALFATLNGDVKGNLDADAYLAYEQKIRLDSVDGNVSESVLRPSSEEVALQTEARRLIQLYSSSAIPGKLWVHCLRESCENVRAAAMRHLRLSDHYVRKQRRNGQAVADHWLDDVIKSRFRYYPVVNPVTDAIQRDVVCRSDSPMSDEAYVSQIEAINKARREKGRPAIEMSAFALCDSVGPKTWPKMPQEVQDAVTRMSDDWLFRPFGTDEQMARLNTRLWEHCLVMSDRDSCVAGKMFAEFVERYAQVKKRDGQAAANDWLVATLMRWRQPDD